MKRQEEQEASKKVQQEAELPSNVSEAPFERRVGMKSKREDDNDDVEWEEEAPSTGILPLADVCISGFYEKLGCWMYIGYLVFL